MIGNSNGCTHSPFQKLTAPRKDPIALKPSICWFLTQIIAVLFVLRRFSNFWKLYLETSDELGALGNTVVTAIDRIIRICLQIRWIEPQKINFCRETVEIARKQFEICWNRFQNVSGLKVTLEGRESVVWEIERHSPSTLFSRVSELLYKKWTFCAETTDFRLVSLHKTGLRDLFLVQLFSEARFTRSAQLVRKRRRFQTDS